MRDWNHLLQYGLSNEAFFYWTCWTVPMRDWNIYEPNYDYQIIESVEPYLWEIETSFWRCRQSPGTGKMGYNENRKRSKYCCWTVPMRDWNLRLLFFLNSLRSCWTVPMRDWNKRFFEVLTRVIIRWTVPMRDWNVILLLSRKAIVVIGWTVPMRDWNVYLYFSHIHHNNSWTVPMRDWNFFQGQF